MKKRIKEFVCHIIYDILVAIIDLISRPDFLEILQLIHTIYDLIALHFKWLPDLPPMP